MGVDYHAVDIIKMKMEKRKKKERGIVLSKQASALSTLKKLYLLNKYIYISPGIFLTSS